MKQIQLASPRLTPSSRSGRLPAWLGRCARALRHGCLLRRLSGRLLCLLRRRRAVPIVHHLAGEDHVEGEAGDESIKDELVVDLLQGGEDAGQGSDEVVENLNKHSS